MSSDRHPLAVAADWLAVCVECGQEHQPRQWREGFHPTYTVNGHSYRPRVQVLQTNGWGHLGVIAGLREEASDEQ